MTRLALLLLSAVMLTGPVVSGASAADLRNVLGDFTLESWGQKDGLDSSVIWAIAQDSEGYIWLGTDAGAVRFDGVRFVPWNEIVAVSNAKVSVRSITVASDGSLWFGFAESGGIARIRNGEARIYGPQDGLPGGGVNVLFQDAAGAIWAGNRAGLHRFAVERWETVGRGLPAGPLYSAFTDRSGNLLVATPNGLFRRPRGEQDFHPYEEFESLVRGVAEDADGTAWLTDPIVGYRRPHERRAPSPSVEKGRGSRLLHDRRGNLWLGTQGQGLWRIRHGAGTVSPIVEKTTSVTGFSDDGVTSLFEDREGNIWAGTLDGLNRLTPHKMTPVLNLGLVSSVDATPDGRVWVGTADALIEFPQGDVRLRRDPDPLDGAPLAAMHADERGTLWVATNRKLLRIVDGRSRAIPLVGDAPRQIRSMTSDFADGLWLYDLEQGLRRWNGERFLAVTLPQEVRQVEVVSSYSDRDRRAWFGLADGRVLVAQSNGRFDVHGKDRGLTAGPYRAIHQDRQGVIWLGGNDGLSRFTDERFQTVPAGREFPAESLTAIVDDATGHLWLATEGSGVMRVHHGEIAKALSNPSHTIRFSHYDKFDGFAGTPRWFGNRSAVAAKDGRLWFVAGRGITVIDPNEFRESPAAPMPARIEGVVADDRRLPATPDMAFSSGTTRLQIQYTALNLAAPLKTHFRFRLEGFDPDWIEAGTRRQAFYTNLPPRSYRFHVVSSRNDGAWDEPGATWAFTIQPMFYQTSGFILACAMAAALAVGGAWRLHLRRVRKEFSLLLGERVRVSREIHDTLLQSLFGVALQCDAMARDIRAAAPHLAGQFGHMRDDVEEDIREARQSIWNLRSPRLESRGLVEALREVGRRATASTPDTFVFETIGSARPLRHDVEEQLLRIGGEAVSNAVRHARASAIRMELVYTENGVALRVKDDGIGFDPAIVGKNGHYGLASMRERAESLGGRLRLESRPGQGTLIEVEASHG